MRRARPVERSLIGSWLRPASTAIAGFCKQVHQRSELMRPQEGCVHRHLGLTRS